MDTNYKKGWKATNPKRLIVLYFLTDIWAGYKWTLMIKVGGNVSFTWGKKLPKTFFFITFLTSEVITSENQRLKGEEKKAKMRKLLLCDTYLTSEFIVLCAEL